MRCEEAVAILEDYVEGGLGDRAANRLVSHLSECEECEQFHQLLKREQDVYSRYLLDVEATPLLWANVRKGIETEDAQPKRKSFSWLPAWPESIFNVPFRPSLAMAAAVIVVAVISFIVMRPLSRQQKSDITPAQLAANRNDSLSVEGTPATATTAPASSAIKQDSSPIGPSQQVSRRYKSKDPGRGLRATRTESEDVGAWLRSVTATGDPSGAEKLIPASSLVTDDLNNDAVRHVQKAEVLLRSFRNSRAAVDLSYEKRQSRELIVQNIFLRREAQVTGDLAMEELLSRLEPILIDIANLPQKISSHDVSLIKEQMRKEGIVSALHFRQTSPTAF